MLCGPEPSKLEQLVVPVSWARPLHSTNAGAQVMRRQPAQLELPGLLRHELRQCITVHWSSSTTQDVQPAERSILASMHDATAMGLVGVAMTHWTSVGQTTVVIRILSSSVEPLHAPLAPPAPPAPPELAAVVNPPGPVVVVGAPPTPVVVANPPTPVPALVASLVEVSAPKPLAVELPTAPPAPPALLLVPAPGCPSTTTLPPQAPTVIVAQATRARAVRSEKCMGAFSAKRPIISSGSDADARAAALCIADASPDASPGAAALTRWSSKTTLSRRSLPRGWPKGTR